MISPAKKQELLSRIADIENFIILGGDGVISIGTLCNNITAESIKLARATDSLTPILRTALVINWRESAMKSRYERFVNMFPDISTLIDLKRIIDSIDAFHFCKVYLNINANSSTPDKNPKYRLLRELINGFLEYQNQLGILSEIEAIRHWSERVDLSNLKDDFIGKRHGVGVGVVENIRLNLGYRIVKPDRHIIGVMKNFLQVDIPPSGYSDFAKLLGIDPRYFDCILFEYGKAKSISA